MQSIVLMANFSEERERRKGMFGGMAEEYHAVRPGYPHEIFEMLADAGALGNGMKALEIGCGSGRATERLIEYDLNLCSIDPSDEMLRVARNTVNGIERVRFEKRMFESYNEERENLDLIIAATSWHWVQPSIGYRKAARLLGNNGKLVILANLHPRPIAEFFQRIQTVYRTVVPEWGTLNTNRGTEDVIRDSKEEMEESGYFGETKVLTYRWKEEYTRERFLRLLGTYSDHRNLGEERLGKLQEGIGQIIDIEYGGVIVKEYETVAYVGTKRRE